MVDEELRTRGTLDGSRAVRSRGERRSRVGFLVVPAVALGMLAASIGTSSTPVATRPAVEDALTLLDLWIDEQLAYSGVPSLGIGVVYDGELIWSGAYGYADLDSKTPTTTATPYRLGSVSKIFTATAVLQLRDRGALKLDDPVTQYLPGFTPINPFPEASPITIRHLLTHTAGLPREGAFPYWTTHEFPGWKEFEAAARSQTLTHPPGEHYHYSNLGVGALGAVIEAVSHQSFADFVRDEITAPLGMSTTTAAPSAAVQGGLATQYFRRRSDGSRGQHSYYDTGGLAATGNVVSTVEDLARFAAFLLGDGSSGDERVLSKTTLREMQRTQFVYPSFSGGRGLGFGVSRRDDKTLVSHGGWIGGHRSHLLLSPDERLAVVAMTNADDASPYFFTYEALDLLSAAFAEGQDSNLDVATDPSWTRYHGLYSDPWEWEYRVLTLHQGLVVYEYSYPPSEHARSNLTPLEPVGEHAFRMPDGDPFIFELDDQGSVERIQRRSDYIFPVPLEVPSDPSD